MSSPPIPLSIESLIYNARFRFTDERDLQEQIAALLETNKIVFTREFSLSQQDRIDFICLTLSKEKGLTESAAVGIEVKVDGSLSAIERQLWRYAASPMLSRLILVTTRSRHTRCPAQILDKPISVVHLLNSVF